MFCSSVRLWRTVIDQRSRVRLSYTVRSTVQSIFMPPAWLRSTRSDGSLVHWQELPIPLRVLCFIPGCAYQRSKFTNAHDGGLKMPKGHVIIDEARCKGCALCTTACPPQVLVI